MKIQVTDVHSDQGFLQVKFNSPLGNGTALWSRRMQKIAETLDVGLELDDIFSWKKYLALT
jgi:hypothetical protein